MLIDFCSDNFECALKEYRDWVCDDARGATALAHEQLEGVVAWLAKYNVARNFPANEQQRLCAIRIVNDQGTPQQKFQSLGNCLNGNRRSLCSKLIWLSDQKNTFMYDRFVHRALVVLTRLSGDEPLLEIPQAEDFLESWNRAVLRIHNRWLPHIRARMPSDLQGVRHERRITDKLLMLLGGADFR